MADSEFKRDALSQFFSPEVASHLAENEDLLSLNELDVEFIYVLVCNRKFEDIRPTNNQIAAIAFSHGALVMHRDGYVTCVAFGIPNAQSDANNLRRRLVDELATQLPDCLSIVHGNRTCLVGNVGSDRLINYGYLNPDYHEHMRILFALKQGETCEV